MRAFSSASTITTPPSLMPPRDLIGQAAPPLDLLDSNGQPYHLRPGDNSLPIALFFYPKAGTYGCTREACQFRDLVLGTSELGEVLSPDRIRIIGLSPDPVDKQRAFVQKHRLPFTILSDTEGFAKKAYHVGKGLLGYYEYSRATFIIDGKGIVRAVLDVTLKFSAHSRFVAHWVRNIEAEVRQESEAPPFSSPKVPTQLTNTPFHFDESDVSSSLEESDFERSSWDDDPGLFTTLHTLRSRGGSSTATTVKGSP